MKKTFKDIRIGSQLYKAGIGKITAVSVSGINAVDGGKIYIMTKEGHNSYSGQIDSNTWRTHPYLNESQFISHGGITIYTNMSDALAAMNTKSLKRIDDLNALINEHTMEIKKLTKALTKYIR